jgi:hypothetical protein
MVDILIKGSVRYVFYYFQFRKVNSQNQFDTEFLITSKASAFYVSNQPFIFYIFLIIKFSTNV